MSVFFCHRCNSYIDSDYDGCHESEHGNICDDCECKDHEEEFKESMDQYRKMVKIGQL